MDLFEAGPELVGFRSCHAIAELVPFGATEFLDGAVDLPREDIAEAEQPPVVTLRVCMQYFAPLVDERDNVWG